MRDKLTGTDVSAISSLVWQDDRCPPLSSLLHWCKLFRDTDFILIGWTPYVGVANCTIDFHTIYKIIAFFMQNIWKKSIMWIIWHHKSYILSHFTRYFTGTQQLFPTTRRFDGRHYYHIWKAVRVSSPCNISRQKISENCLNIPA